MIIKPFPFFDTRINHKKLPYDAVLDKLSTLKVSQKEYFLIHGFLSAYINSEDTFNTYRKEVDKFLQWQWCLNHKSITEISRQDILQYVDFIKHPPKAWLGKSNAKRYINDKPNPAWRPFLKPASPSSIKSTLASLSSFFSYLAQEEFIKMNPVALIRQKGRLILKQQTFRVNRKLSDIQWSTLIKAVQLKSQIDSSYSKHYFLLACFYLLGVRISELSTTSWHSPKMGDFFKDDDGNWWFGTVGKGNKYREVAVPDALLRVMTQYRKHLGLCDLPKKGENHPIFISSTTKANLGTRQIRHLVKVAFDLGIEALKAKKQIEEADNLALATVHWLRHTAISNDVKYRPREHIRDDVGHASPTTMDKYIDIDSKQRHASAKYKKL